MAHNLQVHSSNLCGGTKGVSMFTLCFMLYFSKADFLSAKLTEVTQQILKTKDPKEIKVLLDKQEEIAGQLQREIDILAEK